MVSKLQPGSYKAHQLLKYFEQHWDFLQAPGNTKNWITISEYKLTPRVLWHRYQDEKINLGVRFGSQTKYGLIDIDSTSIYHPRSNSLSLKLIRNALEDVGITRYLIERSSYSGGLHIYVGLPEKINSFQLACLLRMALESSGFKLKGGQLEIFPNTKTFTKKSEFGRQKYSLFNGHRLPLQPGQGSVLLDDDLNEISGDIGDFIDQLDWTAAGQDFEKIQELLPFAREWYSRRYLCHGKQRNNQRLKEWQEDTEALIYEGFTDHGQTNELIREIAKYFHVFFALEGNALAEKVMQTVTSLPGYHQYCDPEHKNRIAARCREWQRCVEKYWWPVGHDPKRTIDYPHIASQTNSQLNQDRASASLTRLQQVLEEIKAKAIALPKQVEARVRLINQIAKEKLGISFSRNTLNKDRYKELWHPKYQSVEVDSQIKELSGVESKIEQLTAETSQVLEQITELVPEEVLQENLQLELNSDKELADRSHPPVEIQSSDYSEKTLNPNQGIASNQIDHTPPYMKGKYNSEVDFLASRLLLEVLANYYDLVVWNAWQIITRLSRKRKPVGIYLDKQIQGYARNENGQRLVHQVSQGTSLKVSRDQDPLEFYLASHIPGLTQKLREIISRLSVYLQPLESDWNSGISVRLDFLIESLVTS